MKHSIMTISIMTHCQISWTFSDFNRHFTTNTKIWSINLSNWSHFCTYQWCCDTKNNDAWHNDNQHNIICHNQHKWLRGIMKHSITTFSIMTLSTAKLVTAILKHNTQYKWCKKATAMTSVTLNVVLLLLWSVSLFCVSFGWMLRRLYQCSHLTRQPVK